MKRIPDWVNTLEAARILGITDVGVRKAITDGNLPAVKFCGRSWALKKKDVLEYLRNRKDDGGPGRPGSFRDF